MNVLAIDTTTESLNLALKKTSGEVATVSVKMGYRHCEMLAPWIRIILETASVAPGEIDLVVCAHGPGSFTGLRIGIATAKGLAMGSNIPLVLVSSLDAIAYGLQFVNGTVLPVIDAKKNRFYTAVYRGTERISDYMDIKIDEFSTLVQGSDEVLLSGPAAGTIFTYLGNDASGVRIDPAFFTYNPVLLLELGKKRFEAGEKDGLDTDGPLYLRKSEAEIGIIKKQK